MGRFIRFAVFFLSLAMPLVTLGAGQCKETVQLVPPQKSTFPAPAEIPFYVLVTDSCYKWDIRQVSFFNGTTSIGTATADMYRYYWYGTWSNAAPGTYSITAKAFDAISGTWIVSNAVPITVTTAPKITFTAPVTGTPFDEPASITLVAQATDWDGTVAKVDFYQGATLLGTATGAPYSYTLSNLPKGGYTFSAKATDNSGLTSTTSPVYFEVGAANQLPSVALSGPSACGPFVSTSTIHVSADAVDPDGAIAKVEFYQNGTLFRTLTAPDAAGAFGFDWYGMSAGSYTLTAVATDNRGATATSSPLALTVVAPNTPPAVTMTAPLSGASFFYTDPVTLTASASDNDGAVSKVEFYAGATLLGTVTAAPYTFDWTGAKTPGQYTHTAKATDNLNATTTSAGVPVTVIASNPPTVNLTSPVSGASYGAPASMTLTADAADSDGTITKVDFYQGTTLIGTVTTAPYTYTWSNVGAGNYSITARATDDSGAVTTSSPVSVSVVSITITSPAAGAALTGNYINVSGTFSAPANSGVNVNGTTATVFGNQFYARVPLLAGSKTLTATLTTQAGVTATATRTVSGDGVAPSVEIIADTLQGFAPLTVNYTFVNTGSSNAIVEYAGYPDNNYVTIPPMGSAHLPLTYYAPGVFDEVFTLYNGSLANLLGTQKFVVVTEDFSTRDAMLRSVYTGMFDSLRAGNMEAALSAVSEDWRGAYTQIFTALMPNIETVANQMGSLQTGEIGDSWAEYALIRNGAAGQEAFLISIMRGKDGVWRIDGM